MTLITMAEIRNMRPAERERKLMELRAELSKHRASMMSGAGMENPGVIRAIRKNIARILTVINEERQSTVVKTGQPEGGG